MTNRKQADEEIDAIAESLDTEEAVVYSLARYGPASSVTRVEYLMARRIRKMEHELRAACAPLVHGSGE